MGSTLAACTGRSNRYKTDDKHKPTERNKEGVRNSQKNKKFKKENSIPNGEFKTTIANEHAYRQQTDVADKNRGYQNERGHQPNTQGAGEQPIWCNNIGTRASSVRVSSEQKRETFRNRYAEKDIEEYRTGYQHKRDDRTKCKNIQFYGNEIMALPSNIFIEQLLEYWYGDYEKLERDHGYIQWLFPIRTEGLNQHAQPLQAHEAQKLRNDTDAEHRFERALEMMMDFYGIDIVRTKDYKGLQAVEFKRSKNWKDRFKNLKKKPHNNLRITRILKCLPEFGYEAYQYPLIRFFGREVYNTKELEPLKRSFNDYWIHLIKDDRLRELALNEFH